MSLYRDMQLHVNHDQLVTYPRAVSGSQNVVPFSLDFHKWLFWFMPTEVMYMYIWIIAYYRETQTPQTKSLAVLAYTHCFHTKGACMHSIQATWLCRAVTLSPLWPCASCHLWKAKSNSNIICMTFQNKWLLLYDIHVCDSKTTYLGMKLNVSRVSTLFACYGTLSTKLKPWNGQYRSNIITHKDSITYVNRYVIMDYV